MSMHQLNIVNLDLIICYSDVGSKNLVYNCNPPNKMYLLFNLLLRQMSSDVLHDRLENIDHQLSLTNMILACAQNRLN